MKTPKPFAARAFQLYCLIACVLIGNSVANAGETQHPSYYRQSKPGPRRVVSCDVAVYGGTPAGVTAAIQAAREGKKALLISFNQHVGGLTSGGLTATDLGKSESIGGLALEFYNRLGRKSNFRPSDAEALYRKMLDEAKVEVLLGRPLKSVEMEHSRVLAITLETQEVVRAKMFVDSTYEGDLFAAANVSYHVGREPASTYGESLGGQWQRVSWKDVYQFCRLPLSPYVTAGIPQSGLLPEIASEPHGQAGDGDYKVQAYNFRMYLTTASDKIDFPKPAKYDPARYALLARFLNSDARLRWTLNYTTAPMTDGPVQMRNGDSNNAGSFSSDYVGGNYRWPDGTYEPGSVKKLPAARRGLVVPLSKLYTIREQIFQDHVNYQQGLMYFLAKNPAVPEELRQRVNRFGLDPNEFQATGNWPHQLYVREGRRMISDYVVTQADCESKRIASDSIGLASYAMDSHFCQRVVVVENGKKTVRNEGGFGHACPRPYPVSFRSIVPKKSECINLLVPVCLSSSHVAFGSIRMEPVFMILGQSAGTAAAIAIEQASAVQDLEYAQLKSKLEKDGQRLVWNHPAKTGKELEGIVVDDSDAKTTGGWTAGTLSPILGETYIHDGNTGKGEKTVTFKVNAPQPGSYEVKLLYVANSNRSTKTPVSLSLNKTAKKHILVNQKKSDGLGASLGAYRIDDTITIAISNRGTDGYVVVDGIQLLSRN